MTTTPKQASATVVAAKNQSKRRYQGRSIAAELSAHEGQA